MVRLILVFRNNPKDVIFSKGKYMKTIKCNFKNIIEEDKKHFEQSTCLLLISVGQESHEGDRFSATIDLVNSSFKNCYISLYDSIQRHTMALNSNQSPEYFRALAIKEGDLWLGRNFQHYNALSAPSKIFRWDSWLNHPAYQETRNKLLFMTQEDPSYKDVFDRTINKYLERYCKNLQNPSNFNRQRAEEICFEYVLEECTVLCLWIELNCPFEIYPNPHNDAIEETRRRFIYPNHPNLLRPLTIRFRNAKLLKPQRFILHENTNNEVLV